MHCILYKRSNLFGGNKRDKLVKLDFDPAGLPLRYISKDIIQIELS